MNLIRKGALVAAALSAGALVFGAAAPANAADPTIDGSGLVTIGAAYWQFDEYGIEYGWDVANVYNSSGYIEYPGYVYGGDDYPYCGASGPQPGGATVEANGDLTLACAAAPWGSTGLTAQWTFRVYAESATGYLVRQFLMVSNPTAAPIVLAPDPHTVYYYDGYTGLQGTPGFITSLGNDTVQADDTWFISVDATGGSVAETNAWALTGSAPAAGIVAFGGVGNDPYAEYGTADNTYAPGETKYFVAFTNMVIPATADVAGADGAFSDSATLTDEFASFSGRLIAGLPNDITVVGWGATPVTPKLASTGSATQGTIVLLGSTAGILVLAGGLLIASRKRARVS
jgi:hypothetical protein